MDRQKFIMIFVAAGISAALLVWFLYSSTQAPHLEKTVTVEAAARDLPAGTLLKKSDLRTVTLLEREIPRTAIREERLAINHALLFPVSGNEPLTGSKIASSTGIEGLAATIQVGMRAITVPITDGTSVAGLIPPRAHVDVLFTRPGSTSEAVTTTILEDVVVLAIGRATEAPNSSTATKDAAAQTAVRPATQSATLLATPEQARMIELAKNLGKISLALRNPLDKTQLADDTATTPQDLGLFPPPPPVRTTVMRQPPPPPAKPTTPPKTKLVEVFHGATHVQEAFK
jgi:pilus assembly protein CpaB